MKRRDRAIPPYNRSNRPAWRGFPLALKTKFEIVRTIFYASCPNPRRAVRRQSRCVRTILRGPGSLVLERFATQPVAPATRPRMIGWSRSAPRSGNCCGGEAARGCVVGLPGHLTSIACFGFRPCRPAAPEDHAFEQRQGTATARKWLGATSCSRRMRPAGTSCWPWRTRRLVENLASESGRTACIRKRCARLAGVALRDRLPVRRASRALVLSVGARSSQLVSAGASGFSACHARGRGQHGDPEVAEELELESYRRPRHVQTPGVRRHGGTAGWERANASPGRKRSIQFVRRLCAEILRLPPFSHRRRTQPARRFSG